MMLNLHCLVSSDHVQRQGIMCTYVECGGGTSSDLLLLPHDSLGISGLHGTYGVYRQ